MFNDVQNELDSNIRKLAESSLIKKLKKQGIERRDILNKKFEELLDLEIEIIKSDGIKVGAGMAVGIGISIFTGGLF